MQRLSITMSTPHTPITYSNVQRYVEQFSLSAAFPDFSQETPTAEYFASSESDTTQTFTCCLHITKPELDLLETPRYADVCKQFLERLSHGEITLNQVQVWMSSHGTAHVPPCQCSSQRDMANGSSGLLHHQTSSVPSLEEPYHVWHAPVFFENTSVPTRGMLESSSHHPKSSYHHAKGSLSATAPNYSPSPSQSPLSHGEHDVYTFSLEDLFEASSRPPHQFDIPRSIVCHPPPPPSESDGTTDLLSSPEAYRRVSVSSSQPSDTPSQIRRHIKWINSDATRMKTNKKNERTPKTCCPRCDKAFENPAEFVKHMIAIHEKPVEYKCSHYREGTNGTKYYCDKSEWHFSSWAKHHTQHHSDRCGQKQMQHSPSPLCRREIVKKFPIRQRGCWLCNHLSFTAEEWVEHHMGRHRASPKKAMSRTWVMESLLSHPDISTFWQAQVKTLQINTGHFWNLKWSNNLEDSTMSGLIEALETGIYNGRDYHRDLNTRVQLAKAVMGATATERERQHAISSQCMQEIRKEIHGFQQRFAAMVRSAAELADESRRPKRAASSSPLSESRRRDQLGPWLRTQCDTTTAPSPSFDLDLTRSASSPIDADGRLL